MEQEMPESDQRDIYHEEARKPLPPEERARINSDPLEVINEAIRRDRLALLRFWLIALAFAALIGLVFWQSWQLRHRTQSDSSYGQNTGAEDDGKLSATPTLLDEMPVFPRVDALFGIAPQAMDSATNVIDRARLKNAATALVQAEAHFEAQKYAEAAEYYQLALEAVPSLRGIDEYLAVCHLQNQDHRKAIEQFSIALKHQPDSPSLLNNLGTAHLALEEFDAAGPALLRCVQVRPRYALAHYNLGWLYSEQERYGDAAHHLKTLLDLRPDHFKGLQLYANALLAERRWGDAAVALKQIIGQVPDAAPPYFHLAQALAEEGKADEAVTQLSEGVSRLDLHTAHTRLQASTFDKLRDLAAFEELLASVAPRE